MINSVTSSDFLNSKLIEAKFLFSDMTFRMDCSVRTNTYIIEVKPLSRYKNDENYICFEAGLMYEFENLFFPETLLFVSDESLTQINQ